MKTRIEKKSFSKEKCCTRLNRDLKNWFYYKTQTKTFGPRIRAVCFQYSLDELWGTLTDKLFREKMVTIISFVGVHVLLYQNIETDKEPPVWECPSWKPQHGA